MHEFHAVGPLRLYPRFEDARKQWLPRAAVPFLALPDALTPAPTAARRTLQMRELARKFTAHTIDDIQERWQLRLLSRPLYRYEKPDGEIIDGALFAFVMPEPIRRSSWPSRRSKKEQKKRGDIARSASPLPVCTCNTRERRSGLRCATVRRV